MTEPTNFRTYPWGLECPTIQWCEGKTHSPGILLKITNDLKNLRASATRKRSQADTKTIIQLTELTTRQPSWAWIDWHTVFGIYGGSQLVETNRLDLS